MIVVTINYRLGAFGFLHIKNTPASGNQGILDQHLAIKWVYQNAYRFGGDQNRYLICFINLKYKYIYIYSLTIYISKLKII